LYYYIVEESKKILLQNGFEEIFEADSWKLTDCGKYFFVRNGTTLVAFTIGGKFETDLGGFTILGAHSDSPCLKISHGT